jgi:beta-galactosidase
MIKNLFRYCFSMIVIFCLLTATGIGQRSELNLSGIGWNCWLDKEATWANDSLWLPDELNLASLPVNKPTIGWDALWKQPAKSCNIPASVEELFGTGNDWTYHGVSWFYREFDLPAGWNMKHSFLTIEQYNYRVEVFINEQLAGYDAIGMLPYSCDIAKFLNSGSKNRIALRITNPGGNRGWEDFKPLNWGGCGLVPSKDYSGIGGKITLTGCNELYVENVFVKNLPKSGENNLEVQTNVINSTKVPLVGSYLIDISDPGTGKSLYQTELPGCFYSGTNTLKTRIQVPMAKLWSVETPAIYKCRVTLKSGQVKDIYDQSFGFRVFEVKNIDGKNNFYLNGKRFRFRSAIDWGIYAFTGLYPTPEVAKRSIEAVRKIGHNSLNFHRRLGDASLFDNADTLGVCLYEEPGGFHLTGRDIDVPSFMSKTVFERLRRMVIRDRNHPSLMIYSLANEDNIWGLIRQHAMQLINQLDDSRLIVNSSGGTGGRGEPPINHIRPYEKYVRQDYIDPHTVAAKVFFDEKELLSHNNPVDSTILYWGEVRCYPGTFNSYLIFKQNAGKGGYDLNLFESQAKKTQEIFDQCRMKGMENGRIKAPEDLSKLAAGSQYYIDGRLGQIIMLNNNADGYAINGFSPGPDMPDEWSSALTDLNRNMNAPPEEMNYWNRDLQIAILRTNGKYFLPGDTAKFNIHLINEGKLPGGEYELRLQVKDGTGKYTEFQQNIPLKVEGGDAFAQKIKEQFPVIIGNQWHPGYITLEARLMKADKVVADGAEQVLLKNRKALAQRFKGNKVIVFGWQGAQNTLKEAGVKVLSSISAKNLIMVGKAATESELDQSLKAVKDQGANLVIAFDSLFAVKLFHKGLLSDPVETWGGVQTEFWRGNGSGYIDLFGGTQAIASVGVVNTRSWEATGNPVGFYPFRSAYPQKAYGLYFARHYKRDPRIPERNNTLVLIGELEYGKGKILLNPCYPVDENSAFADMLFFNIVEHYLQ